MLDINLFRQNPDVVRTALQNRQMDPAVVDRVLALDADRRDLLGRVETLKAERNNVSREIGKSKDAAERQAKIEAMRKVGDEISALDEQVRHVDETLDAELAVIPNIPQEIVPIGKDEHENPVVRVMEGECGNLDFPAQPHWDLGVKLGILNFEQGVKLSGTRFYVLSGAGARLQRALIAWMLDLHARQGYREQYLPFMVKQEVLFGAGQLPKFRDNLYHDVEEDYWNVPTAEVPLTGLHMGDILEEAALPLRYMAYTPCFRREKMSAGRDVRGIKRGHQFDKVEMYTYCRPEDSTNELNKMLADAEVDLPGFGSHLPRGGAMHRRPGLWRQCHLRPGSVGPRLRRMAGSVIGFQRHRLPIAARQHQIPSRRWWQGPPAPHPQRVGAGPASHHDRRAGKLPAARRLGRRSPCAAPLDGRHRRDPPRITMEPAEIGLLTLQVVVLSVMLVGLLGLIFPILPGLTIIWLAALVYGVVTGFNWVSGVLFGVMTVFMLVGNVLDNFIMGASARQQGASWIAIAIALVLAVAGSLIFPPFGGLIAALLGLFVYEFYRLRDWRKALDSVKGMASGCGWSAVARAALGLLMIGLWVIWATLQT